MRIIDAAWNVVWVLIGVVVLTIYDRWLFDWIDRHPIKRTPRS